MILFDGNGKDACIVIRLRLLSREFNVTPCPLNQTGLVAVTITQELDQFFYSRVTEPL
jgi:hypothetical protein